MPYLCYPRAYKPRGRKRSYGGSRAAPAKRRRITLKYRKHEFRQVSTNFPVDPNTTGAVQHLTAIAQGDDTNDRQGNQVQLRRLVVRGNVVRNVGTSLPSHLRMMIVRDNLGTTTAPGIAAMFSTVATFIANRSSLGDSQTEARFTVLFDKFIAFALGGVETVGFSIDKKLNSLCLFSGPAASDEGKGALYLFIASDQAALDPVVEVDARIYYTDS